MYISYFFPVLNSNITEYENTVLFYLNSDIIWHTIECDIRSGFSSTFTNCAQDWLTGLKTFEVWFVSPL